MELEIKDMAEQAKLNSDNHEIIEDVESWDDVESVEEEDIKWSGK